MSAPATNHNPSQQTIFCVALCLCHICLCGVVGADSVAFCRGQRLLFGGDGLAQARSGKGGRRRPGVHSGRCSRFGIILILRRTLRRVIAYCLGENKRDRSFHPPKFLSCFVAQYGRTALHLACRAGFHDVVKMLCEYGACLNPRDTVDAPWRRCFVCMVVSPFEHVSAF